MTILLKDRCQPLIDNINRKDLERFMWEIHYLGVLWDRIDPTYVTDEELRQLWIPEYERVLSNLQKLYPELNFANPDLIDFD